ncbi:MAG: LytTR family transcriptional regulator, partial [Lachnospiraceae bacterium]
GRSVSWARRGVYVTAFTLKNMDGTWRFRLMDILWFYSDRRKVILVTAKGEYPFYARLDEIEKQLCADFVRIHQRYLINPARADFLGSESVTICGRNLPCSRKYRETALRKIARSMMGGSLT